MSADKFKVGVNLGGWLSQYPAFTREHFETFITRPDIEQIASWGMDHVRLPVDYPVLESDEQPFAYREEGLAFLDKALEWGEAYGLDVVLDLHKAPGFAFDRADAASLFDDPVKQARLLALWEMLAERYRGVGENLAFELLNEIVLPDSAPWNELARRAIAAIRKVDGNRLIVVGGNRFNIPATLRELDLPDDPRLLYTFHFYDPLVFTHQKAYWIQPLYEFGQTVEYPGEPQGIQDFIRAHPESAPFAPWIFSPEVNRECLVSALQPALDFMQQKRAPLYCGEFGVIDLAPRESSLRWHRDFVGLLREHNIGRAVWSYKKMDFGLVDAEGRVVSEELVRIVSAR